MYVCLYVCVCVCVCACVCVCTVTTVCMDGLRGIVPVATVVVYSE